MLKFYGVVTIEKIKLSKIGETHKIDIYVRTSDKNNETVLDLEAWDTAATYIHNNMEVGDLLYVEGFIKKDEWEKDDILKNKICLRITYFKGLY